ncbi:MICOS complex subunit MIC27 [Turdus rufiventris]|nr:MICOS complex subunit MIC27 [Turdus rufiventris]
MAAKVAKLAAVSSGLPFVCITVYAAAAKESQSQLVKPDKLPIYSAPPPSSRYMEEQPGLLQQQLSALRTTTGRYFGWCQSVYVFVKNGIMGSIQFGQDAYDYLNNPPPDFLPKAAVITVSGLTGLVLARKGSRFKKIAYPLGLTTVGYSVCYPAQSVVIAKLQQESKPIMQEDKKKKGISSTKPESAVESRSFNRTESSPAESWSNEDPVPSSGTVKTSKFKADPKLTDHGQSSPEDVDMYSTRS